MPTLDNTPKYKRAMCFHRSKTTRALACVIRLAVRLHGLNVLALIRANLYVLAALFILRKY